MTPRNQTDATFLTMVLPPEAPMESAPAGAKEVLGSTESAPKKGWT